MKLAERRTGFTRVASALSLLAGVLLAACGSDGDGGGGGGSQPGGSCVTADGCFEVSDPPDYDVASDCGWAGGIWSASLCDTTGYARKCTQITQVSENGGPEQDVTYVYYWPQDSSFTCLGTEEPIGP